MDQAKVNMAEPARQASPAMFGSGTQSQQSGGDASKVNMSTPSAAPSAMPSAMSSVTSQTSYQRTPGAELPSTTNTAINHAVAQPSPHGINYSTSQSNAQSSMMNHPPPSSMATSGQYNAYSSTPYNTMSSNIPYNTMSPNTPLSQSNHQQYKRPFDEVYAQNAKRPKMEGLPSPSTMGPPMSMGPPNTMGPPSALQKKKDQAYDEGDPNDVFGGAGIDLQDEERTMTNFDVPVRNNGFSGQQSMMQQHQDRGDRARKSDFLHQQALEYFIGRKLSEIGLPRVDPEVLALLSLATKDRLSGLLGQMIVLAKHRCAAPPKNGKPLDDVGRILKSISLAEAQDEERRRTIAAARRLEEEAKRKEAEEAASSVTSTKKKISAAKSLTEQAQARNANATANMMLNQSGGKKYSWMTGAPNTSQLSRRNAVPAFNGIQPNVFKTGAEEFGSLITLKDFIAALELEGEDVVGRGGKALLKAYTQLKD